MSAAQATNTSFFIRYDTVMKLIFKVAHDFHKTTGVAVDELIAQGNLLFCEATLKFEPERGAKFSTFLYWVLQSGLSAYVSNEYRLYILFKCEDWDVMKEAVDLPDRLAAFRTHLGQIPRISEESTTPAAVERRILLKQRLAQMSKHARDVVSMVLDSPSMLRARRGTPTRNIRRKLSQRLEEQGWPKQRIRGAFDEIRATLATI